jgi:hypothetical protein
MYKVAPEGQYRIYGTHKQIKCDGKTTLVELYAVFVDVEEEARIMKVDRDVAFSVRTAAETVFSRNTVLGMVHRLATRDVFEKTDIANIITTGMLFVPQELLKHDIVMAAFNKDIFSVVVSETICHESYQMQVTCAYDAEVFRQSTDKKLSDRTSSSLKTVRNVSISTMVRDIFYHLASVLAAPRVKPDIYVKLS